MLIGRRNRVGPDSILVWYRLSAHLYPHISASDAKRHEVGVDGSPLLRHEHLLVAPLVGLILWGVGSSRVSEPKVCGRRWEASQMSIDDGLTA